MQWIHFFRCLLKAVSFLHRNGIYHRDLKPDNIMVDVKQDGGNMKYSPVIIDFGFINMPVSRGGTPGFMAPEVFGANPAIKATPTMGMMDTFALGCILYQIKHKDWLPRFDRKPVEFKKEVNKVRLTNDAMSSLITGLLEDIPHRLSINKALDHPWLNPSSQESDAAILFFSPHKNRVDHSDDGSDDRPTEQD